ncbi:MAG: SDR family oxidoreductase [Verrucomicrobia bacterium]|nr:SDR family oxidoreductase [Verrucomicrobiota bacterium]
MLAITFAPGGRFGSFQPEVAMGAAKSVIERLCRYFAVALARRKITVNAFSSGWTGEQSPWSAADSISPGPQDAYQQFGPYRGGNSAELQKQAGQGKLHSDSPP